jgi:hypothetical protein
MPPSHDATQVGARTRTVVKVGAGLLAAVRAGLLAMSSVAMVQDGADRIH